MVFDKVGVSGMAAKDLCHYLSKVIGREIKAGEEMPDSKITIHVGPDEFVLKQVPQVKDLYGDGYILKHIKVGGKDHIILSGIRWDASRWAVEEFLLQFAGVRWLYTPETEGTGWDGCRDGQVRGDCPFPAFGIRSRGA